MSRLLQHASVEELICTGAEWLTCLDVLPLHEHRGVREAFCTQIHCFTWKHVLQGLLRGDEETITDSDRELEMLGRLRDALSMSESSDITQTLLETVAEVARAAQGRRKLLFFSLVLLLERLDNEEVSLRVMSVNLIHKVAANGCCAAGTDILQVCPSSGCLLAGVC
jgi:serine/threonine-protein kinase ATR